MNRSEINQLIALLMEQEWDKAAQFLQAPLAVLGSHSQAVQAHLRSSDGKEHAKALLIVDDVVYSSDDLDKACACYHLGNSLVDPSDFETKGKLIYGLGNAEYMRGNYDLSKKYYRESLDIFENNNVERGVAEALIQLSDVERALFNLDDAERYGKRALELNAQLNRPRAHSRAQASLQNLISVLEQYDRQRASDLQLFLKQQETES